MFAGFDLSIRDPLTGYGLPGRHTRLAADLMCRHLGTEPFTWGRNSLDSAGETRQTYLAALRSADHHDFAPLLAFVRS